MCALGPEAQNHEKAICVIGIILFQSSSNSKSECPVKANCIRICHCHLQLDLHDLQGGSHLQDCT